MPFNILALPPELISNITDQVDDAETRRSLSRTCSELRAFAEGKLYENVFRTRTGLIPRLLVAIVSRPERAKAIRSIETRCRSGEELDTLAAVIQRSHKVTDLTLESPFCNNCYRKGFESSWQAVLPQLLRDAGNSSKLTTLTIHWSGRGQRYYSITSGIAGIFSHPTLKNLALSCATLDGCGLEGLRETPKRSTALTCLTFIECDIQLPALEIILSLPKKLTHLHLGQNAHHTWSIVGTQRSRQCQYPDEQPAEAFAALAQQRDSVQSLTYIGESRCTPGRLPDDCDAFAGFQSLRELCIDERVPFIQQAVSNDRTAPPGLVSLHVESNMFRLRRSERDLTQDYKKQAGWVIKAAATMHTLERVTICTTRNFEPLKEEEKYAITQLGKAFEDHRAQLRIISTRRRGAIPPILYGEKGPAEELVYLSEDRERPFHIRSPSNEPTRVGSLSWDDGPSGVMTDRSIDGSNISLREESEDDNLRGLDEDEELEIAELEVSPSTIDG